MQELKSGGNSIADIHELYSMERVLALLSNLQHLGLLWSEHLQELWWGCSSTDSLPQQLLCSFIQQLQLQQRCGYKKSGCCPGIPEKPSCVINTSACKISVKKSDRHGNVYIAKIVWFFVCLLFFFSTFTVTFFCQEQRHLVLWQGLTLWSWFGFIQL